MGGGEDGGGRGRGRRGGTSARADRRHVHPLGVTPKVARENQTQVGIDLTSEIRWCLPRNHGHFHDFFTWVVILRVRRASALSLCPNAVVGWREGGREMVAKLPAAFAPPPLSLPPAFAQGSFSLSPSRFFPLFRPRPSFFFIRAHSLAQLYPLSLAAGRSTLQEIG